MSARSSISFRFRFLSAPAPPGTSGRFLSAPAPPGTSGRFLSAPAPPGTSGLRASLALAAAALAWLVASAPPSLAAGRAQGVVNRRGYPKLAILRTGTAPTDPVAIETLHRNFMQADLIVFQGNRRKWWPLPVDVNGFTLRDYNRRLKILQYLSVDIFPVDPPTGAEIVPPPTDPEAALHTSTFTREEFYNLARALGSTTSYPVLAPLDPKWDGVIQKTLYNGRYATWVFANWKSRVFRDYVKAAMAQVSTAGFNGMFFDFGALNYLSAMNGSWWIGMPPYCFRLKSSGWWYWMSFPGQPFEQYGPPPDLASIRAMDPFALDAIQDLDFCGTTGVPAEITSVADAEAMIIDFYREMRAAAPHQLLVWNGANAGAPRQNEIALTNAHGGHEEGFGLRQWTPLQIRRELDMVEIFNAKKKIFIGWNRESDAAGLIYGYVACMMAGGPSTYCEFTDRIPAIAEIQRDPGKPRGHYMTLPAGETDLEKIVYKRSFANAVMYLNPTSSSIDADGMTIGAKSGLVLPPPPR